MLSNEAIAPLLEHAFGETSLSLPDRHTGKVREWYSLPDGKRLIVTTDRLSAFDRILTCVPFKGQVLNQLSSWWFNATQDIIPNHQVNLPDPNALVAVEARPIQVEVIVRGYITGVTSTALWYRYSLGERDIYGYHFPEGLHKNESLPTAIITPTTKGGETGHDERLTCAEVVDKGLLDSKSWDTIQQAALALFARGQEIATKAGLILVDTKYEFGFGPNGEILLIDEVHTPDSSRYWLASNYKERLASGQEPENYDKEIVRIAFAEKGYRGDGPIPEVPADLWIATSQRYVHMYELLTGESFNPGKYPVQPRLAKNLKASGIL